MATNQEKIEAIFNNLANDGGSIKAVMEREKPITEFSDEEVLEAERRSEECRKSILKYKTWMAKFWWKK